MTTIALIPTDYMYCVLPSVLLLTCACIDSNHSYIERIHVVTLDFIYRDCPQPDQ